MIHACVQSLTPCDMKRPNIIKIYRQLAERADLGNLEVITV